MQDWFVKHCWSQRGFQFTPGKMSSLAQFAGFQWKAFHAIQDSRKVNGRTDDRALSGRGVNVAVL